jgi:hypothetical protein
MRPNPHVDKKIRLTQQIDNLKVDIQYLIDEKKKLLNDQDLKRVNADKKQKMGQLKQLSEELKEMHKREKEQAKRANEVRVIGQAVDKIEFHKAKKKNDMDTMTKAKRDKEQRDKAQKVYLDYLETETKYTMLDPKDVPGPLFLHESVLNAYGLCPFIEINLDVDSDNANPVVLNDIADKRKGWLSQQQDGGKVYFNMREMIYNKTNLDGYRSKVEERQADILAFAKDHLTESQYEMFFKIDEILNSYFGCGIKTKKIKEQYKMAIHYLSVLQAETFVPYFKYFTILHKTDIEINDLSVDEDFTAEETRNKTIARLLHQETFQSLLDQLNVALTEVEQRQKFVCNTLNTLKNELYMFLTKQKDFTRIASIGKKNVVQPGKYFKRWTNLSEAERNERFESYANYYIERYMVQEGLLSVEEKPIYAAELAKLLQEKYKEKRMVYRDFVWSTKNGLIERVKILRFDREKKEFVLNYSKKQPSKDALLARKKVSVRTIFTKEAEKTINDEILRWLVEAIERGVCDMKSKSALQECMENIKDKLKFKKMTNEDKAKFSVKYQEMLTVITLNKDNM